MISGSKPAEPVSLPPTLAVTPPDPKASSYRLHCKMGPIGGGLLIVFFLWELLRSLPDLLLTRLWYRRLQLKNTTDSAAERPPRVAWVGSNLDEVNGIALSSRKLLRQMRSQGHALYMYGVAFHTKAPRTEGPDQSIVMAPGRYSVDQAGYASSELALVDLKHFSAFLRGENINFVEFETPGPVEGLCLIACRIAGVKTCSHYRTDIFTYSEMLVNNALGVWCIQTWTRWFTRLAGAVVVPSEAYRTKVAEMGVPTSRIFKLARGVDQDAFHPDHGRLDTWAALHLPPAPAKLLYVGRISKEKNLEALVEAVLTLAPKRDDFHLAVVGDGPYREAMQASLAASGKATFTGVLTGKSLSGIFASADLFVFPSTTDTFGNSVVEALASGLPCLVSDQGGPCEIVRDGNCGFVFTAQHEKSLTQTLEHALNHRESWQALRTKARERAQGFTFEHSAQEFWSFYRQQL
jgi:glycosyltransferase involved in cell wall biosynthesis